MPDARYSEKGVIPLGTVAVTIGIDTQADGFYWLLACWGRKMELWLPLTDRITGDLRSEEPWNALLEVLETTWLDKEGNAYRPVMSAVDVQGVTYGETLEFVRAKGSRLKLRAVRGLALARALAAGRSFGILRNSYLDKATHVTVTNIDVDIGKNIIAEMLSRKEPGPGYVHLPCGENGEDKGGWDQETIAELTAEYRRETNVRGYTISRWYKRGGRPNHRLDCAVYALAALALSRLKIDDCELQRVEARNVGKPEREKDHQRPAWGAQPYTVFGKRRVADYVDIGGRRGFGVPSPPDQERPTAGFGAVPGSGLSF
jgi:phage terminase large subunit GpA-like protein